MKQIKKIIIILILFFLSLNIASAMSFWSIKNIVENTNTKEVKLIEYGLPWTTNEWLIQKEINKSISNKKIWETYFENWKLKCHIYDVDSDYESNWNCEDNNKELKILTFNDLSKNDKLILIWKILYKYIIYLIIWIPLNFFVFFSITYPIFWNKFSLKIHLIISILLTIIMDIFLNYFNISIMLLVQEWFWWTIYFIFIIIPKIIIWIIWYYFYRKYKKLTKK